jgi:hypothetical protein
MPKRKNSPAYGKGDWKRPVDEKKYSENWDRIFNKGEKNETNTGTSTTPSK